MFEDLQARGGAHARIAALEANLTAIVEVCALAGIGSNGQTVLCRVKDLHAALGHQIERGDALEAENNRLADAVATAYLRAGYILQNCRNYDEMAREAFAIREAISRSISCPESASPGAASAPSASSPRPSAAGDS